MLKIIGNRVFLTRGDSAVFHLSLKDSKGDDYAIRESDVLVLTVKRTTKERVECVQIKAQGDTFVFRPEDTKELQYGAYVYDVQLTDANGAIQTVIAPSGFFICDEVTI